MTIQEAITRIDEHLHNTYSQSDKIKWLSRADGIIYRNIIKTHMNSETAAFEGYDDNTALDTVLIATEPYSELYIRWLEAQIHYANGEYGKHNNAILEFNTEYEAYGDYYNRNYTPICSGKRFVF